MYRAGAAEYPFKRSSVGITDRGLDDSAEQDDQQPAAKKQRTGPEPGIANLYNKTLSFTYNCKPMKLLNKLML
jgi:hypothetical protein